MPHRRGPIPVRLAALLLAALLLATSAPAAARGGRPRSDLWWLASRGLFRAIVERGAPDGRKPAAARASDAYLVGLAYLRLHQTGRAKAWLESARTRGYRAPRGWDRVATLLARIQTVEEALPPVRASLPKDADTPRLVLHASVDEWTMRLVLSAPRLLARASAVLGEDIPPTRIVLLSKWSDYERVYQALYGSTTIRSWQHGAGRCHAVLLCGENMRGERHKGAAKVRLVGDLAHEYGHALLEARYGDGYLRRVPEWLNEGLADAIARPFGEGLYTRSRETIRQAYAGRDGPTYTQLVRGLYREDSAARYAMGRLMVERLLGDEGDAAIRPLIDEARRRQDFEGAMWRTRRLRGKTLLAEVLADARRAPAAAGDDASGR